MTKLNEIPVHVEFPGESMSMLLPILHEIVAMHKTLISSGQGNSLDLRHEPLTLDDRTALKELLGQGEVDANLNALGSTHIQETSISGVWWITHFNQEGTIIGEYVEISTCPDMLKTFPEELKPALARLEDKVSQYAHAPSPDEIAMRLNQLGFCSSNMESGNLN